MTGASSLQLPRRLRFLLGNSGQVALEVHNACFGSCDQLVYVAETLLTVVLLEALFDQSECDLCVELGIGLSLIGVLL